MIRALIIVEVSNKGYKFAVRSAAHYEEAVENKLRLLQNQTHN
jgi:hypothetical protein